MSIEIPLPDWLTELNEPRRHFDSDSAAMAFVIEATRRNIDEGGGPFGAMVADAEGRMVAIGVNRVAPAGQSTLHGEVVALLIAQQKLGTHYLPALGQFTLFTSCAPCDMCCGAVRNAGIRRLVCGARTEDAEAAGFDEGLKPGDWITQLQSRGISVESDILRAESVQLLTAYIDRGGEIY